MFYFATCCDYFWKKPYIVNRKEIDTGVDAIAFEMMIDRVHQNMPTEKEKFRLGKFQFGSGGGPGPGSWGRATGGGLRLGNLGK